MSSVFSWSADERALVVNTLVSYLKANDQTPDHVTRPGWFAFYMQQAQAFLPQERKRNVRTMTLWMDTSMRAAFTKPTPPTEVDSVAKYVRANLDAVIAELTKTHHVVELFSPRTKVLLEGAPRVKQQRVLVCGVLPNMAASLSKEFGALLDLRFHYSGDRVGFNGDVDHAIGLISFMSHALDGQVKAKYKARYQRVVGGYECISKILRELLKSESTV